VTEPSRAYLSLGSNLGNRLASLQEAVLRLGASQGITVVRSSRVYETEPVGPPQPPYLNAVLDVRTTLVPHGLLDVGLAVEAEMGRLRTERWGPRVIDVDLLTFDRDVVAEPGLTIPHPRMHERAFVLIPLAELDADPPLPAGRRMTELRIDPAGVRLFAPGLSLHRPTASHAPGTSGSAV
jgi:2-amino-4-hydroxy-6-hydroxymethyldihydropteridine diphosphokinase